LSKSVLPAKANNLEVYVTSECHQTSFQQNNKISKIYGYAKKSEKYQQNKQTKQNLFQHIR